MLFTNIFSPCVICLFIFFEVLFGEQKFYLLMRSSLSIFAFMYHVFSVNSKNSFSSLRPSRFSPVRKISHQSFSLKVLYFLFYIHLPSFEVLFWSSGIRILDFFFFLALLWCSLSSGFHSSEATSVIVLIFVPLHVTWFFFPLDYFDGFYFYTVFQGFDFDIPRCGFLFSCAWCSLNFLALSL